jgi:hypothetical protein
MDHTVLLIALGYVEDTHNGESRTKVRGFEPMKPGRLMISLCVGYPIKDIGVKSVNIRESGCLFRVYFVPCTKSLGARLVGWTDHFCMGRYKTTLLVA